MYDELAHIERLYGSVAEYNRVQMEEPYEEYEPTEEEIKEDYIKHETYNKKIELLNGKPSNVIQGLVTAWDAKKPPDGNTAQEIYAIRDWASNRTVDLFDKLSIYYMLTEDPFESRAFYETALKTFAVSVEYSKHSRILTKSVSNLDYDTFKKFFRDLHYARCYPTMNYVTENGKKHILSNCSLGSLRIYDLKMCEVETQESLDKELASLGFNEEEYRKELEDRYRKENGV